MIKNNKIEKFLCAWCPVNDKHDVTVGTFLVAVISYGLLRAMVLVIFVGVVTIVGICAELCIIGGSIVPTPHGPEGITYMTFLFGLATITVMALVGTIIVKISDIKLAHCNVKDKNNNEKDEEK